uniref:Odorant-binding protein 2 n=1 Tax=Anopheles atroparvus TaxID=41427 RepID=A0A182J8Q5_ANOAO
MLAFRLACMLETGAREDQITAFNQPEPVPADRELQCYMYCMFRAYNATKPNGDVDVIDVYHAIPKQYNSVALKAIARCQPNIGGEDPCERAYAHHKCWKEIVPDTPQMGLT